MLIAVASLTIATANADGYNWSAVHPMQIVNNTTVQLEGRTEPSGFFLHYNQVHQCMQLMEWIRRCSWDGE